MTIASLLHSAWLALGAPLMAAGTGRPAIPPPKPGGIPGTQPPDYGGEPGRAPAISPAGEPQRGGRDDMPEEPAIAPQQPTTDPSQPGPWEEE